jgi:hypothetical protein
MVWGTRADCLDFYMDSQFLSSVSGKENQIMRVDELADSTQNEESNLLGYNTFQSIGSYLLCLSLACNMGSYLVYTSTLKTEATCHS